jgi:hypothetical protein
MLMRNKDYPSLALLRANIDFSRTDLADGVVLNLYVAQSIIESLDFERLTKKELSE